MSRCLLFIVIIFSSSVSLAQKTQKVCGSYIYYAPENVSVEDAKRIALERAKISALTDAFGTLVSQNNTTILSNQNGETDIHIFSLGGSEVKGEWIETLDEPEYHISYEQNTLIVKVSVCGKAREIVHADIDFTAKLLRNGTELKNESAEYRNGDDLYLYFQSPIDGYLAVYLLDELSQTVYCLLPYRASGDGAVSIKHDTPYVFFSADKAMNNPSLVDEYVITCNNEKEYNTAYVIFSPNHFVKANSKGSDVDLPRQLSLDEFQKWLSKSRNRDKKMKVEQKFIMIEK